MKKSSVLFMMFATFLYAGFALAADGTAPDLTSTILAIWKAIQDKSGVALILVPVFQLLRTHEVLGILSKLTGKGMQLAVAIITTGGFVVDALAKGQNIGTAIIAGLFTAGGAMLIYDAIRSMKSSSTEQK